MDRASRRGVVRRRRAAVVIVAVTLVVGVPAIARAVAGGTGAEARSSTYVVQAGDTLWSIAVRQASGRDPRDVVDAIARANDVDPGGLVPGQQLSLPDAA